MNDLSRLQVREDSADHDWIDVGFKSGDASIPVTIVAGSSSGTEYTEGDTDATITGTAILWEDAGNALTPVSSAKPLPVSVTGGGDATAANQTTIIGHVDGIEGLLTTIDADTSVLAAVDYATQTTLAAINTKLVTGTDIGDVTINNASGGSAVNIQDGGNTITVDGTVTANLAAGTNNIGDVDVLSIAAGDNNIGNVDIVTVPSDPFGANADAASATGSISAKLRFIASTGIPITGTVTVGSHAVTNAGTFAVQESGSALTALQLIDDVVYTDDTSTHSTGSSKGALMMAAATPTDGSVNANDIGALAMSVDRRMLADVTLQVADADVSATNAVPTKGVPSDIDINGSNANHADKYYTNAGAVTDGIIWSPAAGKRWHVLTLYINVSAAATVTIEDDLAAGDNARWKGELAANSGVVLTYDKEHPFSSGEDAADLLITTTAGNVYVQAVGYEI